MGTSPSPASGSGSSPTRLTAATTSRRAVRACSPINSQPTQPALGEEVSPRVTHWARASIRGAAGRGSNRQDPTAPDRSGIQFKVRLEQTRSACWPLALTRSHVVKDAPVLPDSAISTPSSWVAASVGRGRCAIGASGFAILERGRRWPRGIVPPDSTDLKAGWLWQAGGGLFDPLARSMLSVQGAGWGGGSLISANVFARPSRVYDLVGNVWEWCRTAGSSGLHELKRSAWTSAFSRGNPAAFNDANDFMQDDDTGFHCVSHEPMPCVSPEMRPTTASSPSRSVDGGRVLLLG